MRLHTFIGLVGLTGAVVACSTATGTGTMSSTAPTPSTSVATGEWHSLIDPKLTAWRGYKEQGVPAGWAVINGDLNKKLSVNDLLTKDEYVNKGPGRPVFNQRLRAESVASLQVVDYVAINEWPTAAPTIRIRSSIPAMIIALPSSIRGGCRFICCLPKKYFAEDTSG